MTDRNREREDNTEHNDQLRLFIMFIVRSYNDADPSITIRLIAIPLILLQALHNA